MRWRRSAALVLLCVATVAAQPAPAPTAVVDPHGHYQGDGHDHSEDPHGHYQGDGHDHSEDPHGHYQGDGHDHSEDDPHGHYHGDGHDHSSADSARPDLHNPDDAGHDHAGHSHDTTYVPSAQDPTVPAVFGYMILATRGEKAGVPFWRVLRLSAGPWAACAILLPLYVLIARRRGFRLRPRP